MAERKCSIAVLGLLPRQRSILSRKLGRPLAARLQFLGRGRVIQYTGGLKGLEDELRGLMAA
jgi:hypothetical protein